MLHLLVMADNYLENRYNDCLKLQAKKEAQRRKRMKKYLEAYRKRLKEGQEQAQPSQQ